LVTLNRVIQALEQAEAKIAALEQHRDEPIAIVGLGCRFPRGRSPEMFWSSLESGIDAVSEIPESRWQIDPALRKARWAALLDDQDVTGFDAAFFGMSPREAAATDPQHRLILEVAVEALEDAGIPLGVIRGSRTGAFVGMMTLDYQQLSMTVPDDRLDIHTSTGIGACFGSGRLSHALGLEGPSLSTDTACSSSLVALHLACQSLHKKECDLALAGGVNLMLSAWTMRLFVSMQALSPEGRCRTFDARANGFVRGEGCGMVALKRLSDAIRDGDSIRALIRGSAVNHNGRSSGLTAPNVLSQQALLRQALTAANLSPQDIDYIEAHGIATPLGDPIELQALHAVLGAPRSDGSSCAVGSVKTNVGHLEAAAGIAGVIKTVLALEHERIPPHLHFESLNPRISLQGSSLQIADRGRTWPRGPRPRRAGVSAFGLSGTNAHVVLEEAPGPAPRAATGAATGAANPASDRDMAGSHLVAITARTAAGLRRLVEHHADALERSPVAIRDVAHTTTVRRSHHPHRLAVIAATRDTLVTSLRQWLAGAPVAQLREGRAAPGGATIVFVYPDGDASWPGMGLALYDSSAPFRRAFDRCQQVFSALGVPGSLHDALQRTALPPELVAPALLAVQSALTAAWQSRGVVPDRVVGHGAGEPAAAHAAGILSLEAAAEVVWRRCRRPAASPAVGHLEAELAHLAPSAGQIALFSSATGQRVPGHALDAASWAHPPDAPARLGDALRHALGEPGEPSVVVQLTAHAALPAHPELAGLDPVVAEVVARAGTRVRATVGLGPGEPELQALLTALADVFVSGGAVAWPRGGEAHGHLVRLPTYAWERERHWIAAEPQGPADRAFTGRANGRAAVAAGAEASARPMSPLVVQRWTRDESPHADPPQLLGIDRRDPRGRWLVVGLDGADRCAALASQLRAAGHDVTTWPWPAAGADDAAVLAALDTASGDREADVRGIVVCGSAGPPGAATDEAADAVAGGGGGALHAMIEHTCGAVAHLARVSARRPWPRSTPRLWLVTEATQPVTADPAVGAAHACDVRAPDAALGGAALWGIGRTIGLAHPELRCTRLDVEPSTAPAAIAAELVRDAGDEEIALRGTARYIGSLARTDHAPRQVRREPSGARPFRLEIDRAGILDHLGFRVARLARPGPGEVRIRVASAGLNFMDVMTAMGIYPGGAPRTEPGAPAPPAPIILGGECAGTVDAVGPGVGGLAVGDPVVAVGRGCFGSYLTTDAAYVQRRPAELDAMLAGGVPIVFLTAWYALVTLGRLRTGERVLIHSAATGVGLAAVQIARWLGAEIYATAGTHDKRAQLLAMGLAKVMDSRTQAFAGEVLAATGGEGVDLVLNSLSGTAIEASLAALAADGRCFEIGKTDIYAEQRAMALLPFRRRLSYQAVDLLGFAQDRKARFAALFADVVDAFRTGVLRPLPTEVFEAAQAVDAVRKMATGRHTGKLVVAIDGREVPVEADLIAIDPDASYLVTGGAGRLGVALTAWLIDQGARRIVWLARRGVAGLPASQRSRLDAWRARGVELVAPAGDATRADDVARAVADAEALGPLRGVIHAVGSGGAGAADDRAAMAAQIAGAWQLHRATERCALDFFVVCSSAAAQLGAVDRLRDAAAGAALDGLVRVRRARGAVATSVHWGPFAPDELRDGHPGAAAEPPDRSDRAIAWSEAGPTLGALLAAGTEQASVIRFQVRQWVERYPHLAGGTWVQPLIAGAGDAAQAGDPALLAQLARASEAEAAALIEQLIRAQLAQLLRGAPEAQLERLDPDTPFKALGVDSMQGLELRNRLEAALGIRLSAALMWSYPDLRSLGEYLRSRLPTAAAPADARRPRAHQPQAMVLEHELESELASIERLLH